MKEEVRNDGWVVARAANDPLAKFYNHGEGPCYGLLLVESAY